MTSNFKVFQESVVNLMLDPQGRKIFNDRAMTEGYTESVITDHGDREVKLNMRFMSK